MLSSEQEVKMVAIIFLFLLTAMPMNTWTKDIGATETGTQASDMQKSEEFNSSDRHKSFKVELYGGFTFINPSDLNLLVDYDNKIQEFFYDSYLNYLQTRSQIRSWTKKQKEDRSKIKNAIPLGIRLKYHLNTSIIVSAGFKYLSRKQRFA